MPFVPYYDNPIGPDLPPFKEYYDEPIGPLPPDNVYNDSEFYLPWIHIPHFRTRIYTRDQPRTWYEFCLTKVSTYNMYGYGVFDFLGMPDFIPNPIELHPVIFQKSHPYYSEGFKSYFNCTVDKQLYDSLVTLDSMNCTSDVYYSAAIESLQSLPGTIEEKNLAVIARFQRLLLERHKAKGCHVRLGIKMPN